MYATYIQSKTTDEYAIKAAEHIDILTYNLIVFELLTEYQKSIITRTHSRLTAFEKDNEDMINTYLQSYSINGVSMAFGTSWNLKVVNGVAIPQDLYAMLINTGLCYPAI